MEIEHEQLYSDKYLSLKNTSSNILEITSSEDENGNIELQGKNSYYVERYYVSDFYEENAYKSFVKSVEREIRKSPEYTHYLGKLRELGFYRDTFQGNINDDNATIEFHHYPFSLYDIVSIIVDYCIDNNIMISTFIVSKIVINLHFKHEVGLVPLSVTNHQLAHSGDIFINLNKVFGYYSKFIQEYKQYISFELRDKYNKLVEMSLKDAPYSEIDILQI